MTIIATDLLETRERAKLLRYEPGSGITSTNVQDAIEEVASNPPSLSPTPVSAASSPFTPAASDTLLYVDSTAGPVTINLTAANFRLGKALRIKDVGGAASTNNITIAPFGAETIETLPNYVITADFGGATLDPVSGTGWLFA